MRDGDFPPVSVAAAGFGGTCPRCGKGRLFSGVLALAGSCGSCGLDYSFADSGDGPAVFVILIFGFVVLGLALAFDSVLRLPYWVMALIWGPIIIGGSLWALRVGKGLLIAMQYKAGSDAVSNNNEDG